ncbi:MULTISPECIES: CheR family methyltransferase [Alphaproteobacteria]|uniref:Chemotaxis protein methyltransferase n=2 Tax=Alphaproteobacteria TaxID=28211 RepID=A0A512HL57_9HYPH|nr:MULTISPECIES: protein-glutamate O-methyltransferase CheR [Alphaproteobacteria]GEO86188.1 chemotaxis protein methyltransferase [Ciceribacter naphthalenivorans]GLR21434.1 chemotaxis protein methyltransferase [Ciceribacter naphthalenivorans]GLT04290.1 chemotaxis protein methyltransferase [Sphingomonas psychrolutea]
MSAVATIACTEDHISKRNFDQLSRFIYDYSGIKMPPTKLTMLEGRLRRRLRATGISSFDNYCDYLFKHDGLETEKVFLIDAVTTNKTDFFREPNHFTYLREQALPRLAARDTRRFRIWSSACSTGAEPYTIAMVLDDFTSGGQQQNYSILATDLSTDVLQTAHRGIYSGDMVAPVPPEYLQRYVMRPRDAHRREVRIHPDLRSRVGFARLNLMDPSYSVGEPMHIIFCRNVLIYFDKPTQQRVLSRLIDCLVPGGYLFIGHSETVSGLDLPIRQVANTVFEKV